MPDPTKAEIFDQWAKAVNLLEESDKFGSVNTQNFLDLLDTLHQAYEGDFIDEIEGVAQILRSALNAMITDSVAADMQRPFLRQFMKSVAARKDVNSASDDELLDELYKFFIDNNDRVQSRVFTFGTPVATSGDIGNGIQILRNNQDSFNYDIEAQHIDSKRAICIVDHNTGSDVGNEAWQVEGQSAGRDDLERSGSGLQIALIGQTVDSSILSNAGFQSFDGTAASPTGITDWDSSAGDTSTQYVFDSTNTFRAGPSDGDDSFSIKLKVANTLTQKLSDIGANLSTDVPYVFAVVYNADVFSATGTLNIKMGNTSSGDITIDGQSGWQVALAPASTGWANWYRVFAEDDVQLDIDYSNVGGSGLLIAEALLVPGTFFDGSWYWMMPAAANPYVAPRILDSFTWSDIAADSIIQKWLFRGFGRYLPHANGSSITFSEPT